MRKKTIVDNILNESINEKINDLTTRLENKINIMEVDAHNLEYEQSYEIDNPNGKPKRVIFKGRGRKGKGDSDSQTYHFEDDKGHDIMLSKKGVLNKIKNLAKDMKKQEETEGNAFTKKLKDTPKGGKFELGGKKYTDRSELEELSGNQHKIDKNKNGKIDAEDFEMLRKGKKSETDEQWQAFAEPAIAAATTWALDKMSEDGEVSEDMGGMDDYHPRFGKMNFSKMSHEDILNALTKKLEDEDEEEETETRLEEAKKFIQKAVEKMDTKGTSGKFATWCKNHDLASEEGEVTKKCIDKAMKSDDSKVVKMANFAKNIGGFKGAQHESIMYRLSLTENTSFDMTEEELVDMIEELVIEAKENEKFSGKAKGMVEYERVSKQNKRENSEALKQVEKKMKDYLKDGSKGKYETNPKHFPKGNGELGEMDKKAYKPSDDVKQYVDDYAYPGMTNLNYDEIKPDDEWIEANIKGSAKTGNSPKYANAVETEIGEKMVKNYKKNAYGKEQKNASYKRQSQPVDTAGEKTPKKSVLDKLSENFETEQNRLIVEEFEKMKHLMNYSKKTQ